MRLQVIGLGAALLLTVSAANLEAGKHRHNTVFPAVQIHNGHGSDWDDDTSFRLDDDCIIIYHEYRDGDREEVEFTDKYELYVDGRKIDLNDQQQELVKEFHIRAMEMVDYAKKLGWEGAKIGAEGAKLGITAVACLFKLILPGYDTDDYEDEIERRAEELEDKAGILEEYAEDIEDMYKDIEELTDELRDEIPELDRLGWF